MCFSLLSIWWLKGWDIVRVSQGKHWKLVPWHFNWMNASSMTMALKSQHSINIYYKPNLCIHTLYCEILPNNQPTYLQFSAHKKRTKYWEFLSKFRFSLLMMPIFFMIKSSLILEKCFFQGPSIRCREEVVLVLVLVLIYFYCTQ